MSRQVNGMHVSNFRHWFVEQLHASAHPDGAVTILHFLMRDDPTIPQWSDPENVNWFIKLRDGWAPQGIPPAPRRLVHVRMYHPNWTQRSPEEWARHSVDMLSHIEARDTSGHLHGTYNLWADPFVTVSPANEQNLHYESGDGDPGNQWRYRTVEHYRRIADWNARWAREVKRLVPGRAATLTWPAFAYGHDPIAKRTDGTPVPEWSRFEVPDGEYTIPEVREAIAEYEIMATHPYGHLDWAEPAATRTVTWGQKDAFFHLYRDFRPEGFDDDDDPGGALAQLEGLPFLITECGTFSHSDPDRTEQNKEVMQEFLRRCAERGRVLGATWFIWSTNDAHQKNDIMRNPALRDAIADFPKVKTQLAVPAAGAPPARPTEPDRALDEWVLDEAEAQHARCGVPLNPASALLREGDVPTDAWLPTTAEHTALYPQDGRSYTLQRFERAADSAVKVVYFVTGQWDEPHEVRRRRIGEGVVGASVDGGATDDAPPAHGIDVSHHNGPIDWTAAAAAGVDFALMKATEGWSFIDPRFEDNARETAGVIGLRAPYHYYSNAVRKPASQAEHFADVIAGTDWELPPIVDLEDTTAPFRADEFRRFLDKLAELTDRQPIVYSGRWYVHSYTRALNDYVNGYWQWIASYGERPAPPDGWQNIVLWQYTSHGDGRRYGAHSERIDLNRTHEPFTRADLPTLVDRVPG